MRKPMDVKKDLLYEIFFESFLMFVMGTSWYDG